MNGLAFELYTLALAITLAFGGFAIFPVYRYFRPMHRKRVLWLKRVLFFHLVGAVLGVAFYYWIEFGDYDLKYFSTALLQLVGALSIVASGVVLIVGALASSIRRNAAPDTHGSA